MINWPNDVVDALARRRSVVYLGAGISRNSTNAAGDRPKTWRQFLQAAIEHVEGSAALHAQIRKLLRQNDFLTACEVIKESMGNHLFHELIQDEFVRPRFQPAPIHDSIINLDTRIVATPNFDKIFETRINAIQNNSILVKNYYDGDIAEAVRSTGRMVLKVHGTIDTPGRMIFTRTDYATARHEHSDFYSILEALAITHTFLFLGCGLNDPDVRLLLEDYGFRHKQAAPHYFVTPRENVHTRIRTAVERSLNIQILTYDSRDDHRILKESIDRLVTDVSTRREELTIAEW